MPGASPVPPTPQPPVTPPNPIPPAPSPSVPGPTIGGSPTPAPVPGSGPKLSLSQPMMVLALVVLVSIIVIAGYFLFFKSGGNASGAAKTSGNTSAATSLSTLKGITFTPPADLSNFRANTSTTAGNYSYLTKNATNEKACSLSMAIYTAAQLPGADVDAIVNPQVDKLRSLGATVHGPSAGSAVLLHDDDGKSIYSIPTLNYEFSQDSKRATVHYSVAILKDGERAEISRQCVNASGSVDASAIAGMDNASAKITVARQ